MEKIEQSFCRHYLRTDAEGRIVEGWSDGPHRERVHLWCSPAWFSHHRLRLFQGTGRNP